MTLTSLLKNMTGNAELFCGSFSEIYFFSSYNENSIALAESLDKKRGRAFVFFNVSEEYIKNTKKSNTEFLTCDIRYFDFSAVNNQIRICIFAMDKEVWLNADILSKLKTKLSSFEDAKLFCFYDNEKSYEVLVKSLYYNKDEKINVRLIDLVRLPIYRMLYEKGYDLIFKNALGGSVKKINAVIWGMDSFGTEMIKALSWYCQMDGYRLQLDAFSASVKEKEEFISLCPELMSDSLNGRYDIEGEAQYTINIHLLSDFERLVPSLPETTFLFVAIGDGKENETEAERIYKLLKKNGRNPAVVTETAGLSYKYSLENGQESFGAIPSVFCEEGIVACELESIALARHLKVREENEFYLNRYCYNSSLASAIHKKARLLCGILGADKPSAERNRKELMSIRILEHRRWNAFVRSEGYSYSGSLDKSSRNDAKKLHNCLVPFNELPRHEQEKDDD